MIRGFCLNFLTVLAGRKSRDEGSCCLIYNSGCPTGKGWWGGAISSTMLDALRATSVIQSPVLQCLIAYGEELGVAHEEL